MPAGGADSLTLQAEQRRRPARVARPILSMHSPFVKAALKVPDRPVGSHDVARSDAPDHRSETASAPRARKIERRAPTDASGADRGGCAEATHTYHWDRKYAAHGSAFRRRRHVPCLGVWRRASVGAAWGGFDELAAACLSRC